MENLKAIVKGTIEKIFDERNISQNFNTREFVVKTEGEYSQSVKLQLSNQRCDLIIGCRVGDTVTCHVNIR